MAGSRNFAAAASFSARQREIYDDLCATLKYYNEELVNGLKASDPSRVEVANVQFQLCVELTAILFSEEEAELLRRAGAPRRRPRNSPIVQSAPAFVQGRLRRRGFKGGFAAAGAPRRRPRKSQTPNTFG